MEKLEFANLHYLPIAVFISLPTVIVLSCVIAVLLGHVEGSFPYVSDVTNFAPESCIFSQVINILTMLICFIIYIRYYQVKECTIAFHSPASLLKWNRWAAIFGLIAVAGLSIVANFQEISGTVIHMTGSYVCFGSITVYFWTQAICSFYLHPLGYSLRLAQFRTALSSFCTVSFFVIHITSILSHWAYKGKDTQKWYKEDGGWELHIASTITEWLFVMAFSIYFLTFAEEFRDLRISQPKITYNVRFSSETLSESHSSNAILERANLSST